MATIVAISISKEKGVKKTNVPQAKVVKDFGLEGDAHGGPSSSKGHRQVSLLALESIDKMRAKGLTVGPGDFAENLTLLGLDLTSLSLGAQLKLGKNVLLEISQLGKECHTPCAIFYAAGDCVMPKEGVFARVLRGGTVKVGDSIKVNPSPQPPPRKRGSSR
jgi:MOSC domain-containing protein YiiM